MKTLTLKEAADFLHIHPITLSRMAKSGEIPGAKPGKRWVFIDDDLADWVRNQYVQKSFKHVDSIRHSRSTPISIQKSSIPLPSETERQYRELLGLKK